MKFCFGCGNTTGGKPLFCISCGRSYDVKLCPKLHVNSRFAEVCSQCGNRNLSVPQPRIPISWRFLSILAQAVSGWLLLCLSALLIAALLRDWIGRTAPPKRLSVGIFLLIIVWGLWTQLPDTCRRIIYRSLTRKSGSVLD